MCGSGLAKILMIIFIQPMYDKDEQEKIAFAFVSATDSADFLEF